jgi:hypothetical protein
LPAVEDTVARAKTMLGSAYDPNTKAPTAARLDEIASQSFITPEVKAAYTTSKLQPDNQNYMAASYNATLPKTTVPTSAGAIPSPYQSYNQQTTSPSFGNISFATAGTQGAYSQMQLESQAYFDNLRRQEEARMAQQKESQQSFLDKLISPQEAKEQAWEDTGIDVNKYYAQQEKGFKEIESLTGQYNKLIEAKDSQIAATQDRMASMNFINNQTAQIERNAAPQLTRLSADINAKAAVLQALQGNFAEAQKYVNQAVQDATSMNKYNYDIYEMNYNMNKDNFDRLDQIYTTAYTTKMSFLQMEYEQELTDKKAVGDLLLNYPNAGIDIYNDTYEQALNKAGVRAGQLETMALTSSATDGGTSGLSFSPETYSQVSQLINGQSRLSDYTQSTQNDIRNLLWAMPTPDRYVAEEKRKIIEQMRPGASTSMSNLDGAAKATADARWYSQRMSLAGPGLGEAPTTMGELTQTQASDAINWLTLQPDFDQSDLQQFYSDRQFQAWAYQQSQ